MSSPSLCEKRMNLGSDVNATTTYGSKGWVLSKCARNCFTRRVWFLNAITVRHCAQLTLSHGIQLNINNNNNNLWIKNQENRQGEKETPYIGKEEVSNRFNVSIFRYVLFLAQKIDDIISSVITRANLDTSNHSEERVLASHAWYEIPIHRLNEVNALSEFLSTQWLLFLL